MPFDRTQLAVVLTFVLGLLVGASLHRGLRVQSNCPARAGAESLPSCLGCANTAGVVDGLSGDPAFRPSTPVPVSAALPHRMVMVAGVEGSGTTFLYKAVAKLPGFRRAGQRMGKNVTEPSVFTPFAGTHHDVWSSEAAVKERAFARLTEEARRIFRPPIQDPTADGGVSTIVVHRSLPDFDTTHVADLTPKFLGAMAAAGVRFQSVIVLRNPAAAVASAFRRGFHKQFDGRPDVLHQARMTEKNLLLLAAQLSAMDPHSFVVLSYEDLNSDDERVMARQCDKLAPFLQIGVSVCMDEIARKYTNDVWGFRDYLDEATARTIDDFFDAPRMREFQFLLDQSGTDFFKKNWAL